jgi:hypothetical protein
MMTTTLDQSKKDLRDHVELEGKLKELAVLNSLNWIQEAQRRQAQIEQAENNWYAKQMGENPSEISASVDRDGATDNSGDESDESEIMRGNTILGDVTFQQPPTVVQPAVPLPQPKSTLLPMALLALASAGIPTAGIIGYLLNRTPPAPTPIDRSFDDDSLEIGLGRLEDYLPKK